MATSFDAVNNIFYDLVEADCDFFHYYGLSPSESKLLAQQRADSCLTQAATKLSAENATDIDFSDFDTERREFAADLTVAEIDLLAHLQYERYLYRDFATLRANATRFTSSEQTVFSPANDRKTFLAMFEAVRSYNMNAVNRYIGRDRITGQRKFPNYNN